MTSFRRSALRKPPKLPIDRDHILPARLVLIGRVDHGDRTAKAGGGESGGCHGVAHGCIQ